MKKAISKISMFLLTALAVCSCRNGYVIDGVIDTFGNEGKTIQLVRFDKDGSHVMDSCVVNHGQFHMENLVDEPFYAMLRKDKTMLPVIIEKGTIKVEVRPDNVNVSGTPQNEILYSFFREKEQIDRRFDEMNQIKKQLLRQKLVDKDNLDQVKDSMNVIINECENLIKGFLLQNWNGIAAQSVFVMVTYNLHGDLPAYLRKTLDEAPDEFLQKDYVMDLMQRVTYDRASSSN